MFPGLHSAESFFNLRVVPDLHRVDRFDDALGKQPQYVANDPREEFDIGAIDGEHVHSSEDDVIHEWGHINTRIASYVSFPNFDKATKWCNAEPRLAKCFPRQRVQDYIDTFLICHACDSLGEGEVSGVEDMVL